MILLATTKQPKLFEDQKLWLPWECKAKLFRWISGDDVLDIKKVSDHFDLLISWGYKEPVVLCRKAKRGYTLTKGGLKEIYDTSLFCRDFFISANNRREGKDVWLAAWRPRGSG